MKIGLPSMQARQAASSPIFRPLLIGRNTSSCHSSMHASLLSKSMDSFGFTCDFSAIRNTLRHGRQLKKTLQQKPLAPSRHPKLKFLSQNKRFTRKHKTWNLIGRMRHTLQYSSHSTLRATPPICVFPLQATTLNIEVDSLCRQQHRH